jgi:uncharacterized protein YjbI with pentapeptide repeats
MANAKHLAILQQGRHAWMAWRRKEPRVMPDLNGADLRGADLIIAYLTEANLSGANLSEANLRGAALCEAALYRADLRWANLSEANLSRTDLREANLMGANLRGADLSEARLMGAHLTKANLRGADLIGAHLTKANLIRANLRGANLSEADLRIAHLTKANLREANLMAADLREANLIGANLREANLIQASLVDAYLDGADLTGAKFWETQCGGWKIKNVICRVAFWDRDGKEPTKYEEGEFERIFAEKPRIVLRYPGGMSPVDLLALPMVVERLQAEHPGSELHVRSVQNDGGGASVTITVEDRAGRGAEAFGQEMVRIRAKLECIVEERDRLQQRLDLIVPQVLSEVGKFLALPRQEIHYHRQHGRIEGPAMSKGDTNINTGQAAVVGRKAHAHDNTLQQIQAGAGIDLPKLAEELGRLRNAMKGESAGTPEHDEAIGAVAGAEKAAAKGDGPAALQYLKSAGKWTFGIAEKIGVPLAVEALKRAM